MTFQDQHIYGELIDQCEVYRPTGIGSHLQVDCGLRQAADVGQILAALETKFGRKALLDARVARKADGSSLQLFGSRDGQTAIYWPVREDDGMDPLDLVTEVGCVSGRLPVCAAALDGSTCAAIGQSDNVLVAVSTMEDLAVLRQASLPATLSHGLWTLSGRHLEHFCRCFAIEELEGPPGYGTAEGAKGGAAPAAPARRPALPGRPLHCQLVVAGWSPAHLTLEDPETLESRLGHLRRIETHLDLDLSRVFLWVPTSEEIEAIVFAAEHGRDGDWRCALMRSMDNSGPLTSRPEPASPKTLPATGLELRKAIIRGGDDRLRREDLWCNYISWVHEQVRPLAEQAAACADPNQRALQMAIADLRELAHPQALSILAQLAQSTRHSGIARIGPLPEKELQQFLELNDRLLSLIKQAEQAKWGPWR